MVLIFAGSPKAVNSRLASSRANSAYNRKSSISMCNIYMRSKQDEMGIQRRIPSRHDKIYSSNALARYEVLRGRHRR